MVSSWGHKGSQKSVYKPPELGHSSRCRILLIQRMEEILGYNVQGLADLREPQGDLHSRRF